MLRANLIKNNGCLGTHGNGATENLCILWQIERCNLVQQLRKRQNLQSIKRTDLQMSPSMYTENQILILTLKACPPCQSFPGVCAI